MKMTGTNELSREALTGQQSHRFREDEKYDEDDVGNRFVIIADSLEDGIPVRRVTQMTDSSKDTTVPPHVPRNSVDFR